MISSPTVQLTIRRVYILLLSGPDGPDGLVVLIAAQWRGESGPMGHGPLKK